MWKGTKTAGHGEYRDTQRVRRIASVLTVFMLVSSSIILFIPNDKNIDTVSATLGTPPGIQNVFVTNVSDFENGTLDSIATANTGDGGIKLDFDEGGTKSGNSGYVAWVPEPEPKQEPEPVDMDVGTRAGQGDIEGYVFYDDGMTPIPPDPGNRYVEISTDIWGPNSQDITAGGYYFQMMIDWDMDQMVTVNYYHDMELRGFNTGDLMMPNPVNVSITTDIPAPIMSTKYVYGYVYDDMVQPIMNSEPGTVTISTDGGGPWTNSTDMNGYYEFWDISGTWGDVVFDNGFWYGEQLGVDIMTPPVQVDIDCLGPDVYGTMFDNNTMMPIWDSAMDSIILKTNMDTYMNNTNMTGEYAFRGVDWDMNSTAFLYFNDGSNLGNATLDLTMPENPVDLYCDYGVYGYIYDSDGTTPIMSSPAGSITVETDLGTWYTQTDWDGYYQVSDTPYFTNTKVWVNYTDGMNWYGSGTGNVEVSSAMVDITCEAISAPTAPQNLTLEGGNLWVNLTWDPPTSDGGSPITAYKIYRKIDTWNLLDSVEPEQLSYNDTALALSTEYWYYLRAENAIGLSMGSTQLNITTPGPPPTGNWMIEPDTTESYADENFHVDGNVIVQNGATLILDTTPLTCHNIIVQNGATLKLTNCGNVYSKDIIIAGGGSVIVDPTNQYLEGNLWIDGYYDLDDTILHVDNSYDGEHIIQVNATGSLNVTFNSMIKANQTGNQYRIKVMEDADIRIENSTIRDCGWNSTYRSIEIYTDNAWIWNGTFTSNYDGLYLGSSNNSWIQHSHIYNNSNYGILFSYASGNKIINCNVSDNVIGLILYGYSDNNLVNDNQFSNNTFHGIVVSGDCINNTISFNRCNDNVEGAGMQISESCEYNDIIYNNCSYNNITGIWIKGHYNTLDNNNCTDNGRYGILLTNNASNNTIQNNICKKHYNTESYGIWLQTAHYNDINNNDLRYNWDGIKLNYSHYNEFVNNELTGGYEPIDLDYSNWNLIQGNDITPSENGIYLYFSNNNTVRDNTFVSSGGSDGVYLAGSNDNVIMDMTASTFGNGYSLNLAHRNEFIRCNGTLSTAGIGFYLLNSHNNIFRNCEAYKNQVVGFYLSNSDNTTLLGCNTTYQNGIGDEGIY
jgi:parallel beta-helix repeat protein